MRIRALSQEQRGNTPLLAVDGTPQRRFAQTVTCFDVRATLDQGLANFDIVAPGRHMERGAPLDPVTRIYPGPSLNQLWMKLFSEAERRTLSDQRRQAS